MRSRSGTSGFTLTETLMTVAVAGILMAIALPMTANALAYFRLSGGARSLLTGAQLAKLRAAATFTRSRLYIDSSRRTFEVQSYNLGGSPGWKNSGSATTLANGVSWGYAGLTSPPPNTQSAIGQAAACLDDAGVAISNTSCLLFNSRGIPVDTTGAPTGNHAVYLYDASAVYAVTVSATGMIQLWRSTPGAASWVRQ